MKEIKGEEMNHLIIKEIYCEPVVGADIAETILEAEIIARQYNCSVNYLFNGIRMAISPDADQLVRQLKYFHSRIKEKI